MLEGMDQVYEPEFWMPAVCIVSHFVLGMYGFFLLTGNGGDGLEVTAGTLAQEQRDGARSGRRPGEAQARACITVEATLGDVEWVCAGGVLGEDQEGRGNEREEGGETHFDVVIGVFVIIR